MYLSPMKHKRTTNVVWLYHVVNRSKCLLLQLLLLLCWTNDCPSSWSGRRTTTGVTVVRATEVTWTPNADDQQQQGPLPLSNNQRMQLIKLEESVRQSPNPEATLQQVAQSNQMDPQDLINLLRRNRQDLEQAGGGIPGPNSSRNVWKLASSMLWLAAQSASKHPRSTAWILTLILLTAYVSWTAPRTGLLVSSRRGWISNGPTALWRPPVDHIRQKFLDPTRIRRQTLRRNVASLDNLPWEEAYEQIWPTEPEDEDTVVHDRTLWHTQFSGSREKKIRIVQAASSQETLLADHYVALLSGEKGGDYDNEDEKSEEEEDHMLAQARDLVTELWLEHAAQVLSKLELTEWVDEKSPRYMRLITPEDGRKEHGVLVVANMGDYYRYGLLPLQVLDYGQDQESILLTLGTLPGGHWDGQIHVSVTVRHQDAHHCHLVVRSHVVVPRKGRRIHRAVALGIVEGLCHSVATSIEKRTRQVLVRRSQSARFQGAARQRAQGRRQSRSWREQQIEAMAADRRRRWQRQNPDAGHYRPSGDRLKSPKNAVYQI